MRVMRVKYTVQGEMFKADKPEPWSDAQVRAVLGWNFAPYGQRLLTFPASLQSPEPLRTYHLSVLLNFFDELKRKAP